MTFLTTAFFAFSLLAFKHTHTDDYKMESLRSFYWTTSIPDIVVCNDSEIDPLILEKVITSWEKRGEKIGNVFFEDCLEDETVRGVIEIYEDDKVPGSAYGLTSIKSLSETREILSVKIWIKSDYTDSVILLEHELGHALGFRDTYTLDHVMSGYGFVY